MGWSPTVADTCRKWSTPVSSTSRSRSLAAPSSSLATAREVASTGVPCGIVNDADMKSASMDGKNWKSMRPPTTRPPVTMRVARPTAAVA